MSSLDDILTVAQSAAKAAGQILLNHFGTARVEQKSSQNLVTQADIESEELIVSMIQRRFPNHSFLREEGTSTGELDSPHLWIVDPLDGTNNYAHGIPQFAVSIGYAEEGKVLAGTIYDPTRDEQYSAIRGGGAWRNGRQIAVSERGSLTESIISTGFYYDRGLLMRRTLAAIDTLFSRNIRGIRRMGSAAIDLAWVACGRFEAFFEYQLAPWDYAAGALIVEEAGGRCADRAGSPLTLHSGHIIAANSDVFPPLREAIAWSLEEEGGRVRAVSSPEPIAVYNCEVHVRMEGGLFIAVVANLEGIEATAESERAALQHVVTKFKHRLAIALDKGDPIRFQQPPRIARPGEQTRLIAVHVP